MLVGDGGRMIEAQDFLTPLITSTGSVLDILLGDLLPRLEIGALVAAEG